MLRGPSPSLRSIVGIVSVLVRHVLLGGCALALATVGGVTVVSAAPVARAASPTQTTVRDHADSNSAFAPFQVRAALPAPPPTVHPRPAGRAAQRRRLGRPDPFGRFGFDISWPQCRGPHAVLPPAVGPVAIVGLTGGRPFRSNPCLRAEWAWARSRASAAGYLNLAAPGVGDPVAYGAASARDGLARASSSGVRLRAVWLDVEVGNHWSSDAAVNSQVIRGATSALQAAGVSVGIYSTPLDWRQITHGATLTIPIWQALADGRKIAQGCASRGFGGRTPDLVQAVFLAPDGHEVDGDLICTSRPDFLRLLL